MAVVGSLRRDDGGLGRFLRSVAELWVAGGVVDWQRVFAGSGGVRVGLPSYAFQRERFWLKMGGGVGDVSAAGLARANHPLLGAVVGLAGGGCVCTGRLSLESHPWLADHAVRGVVLLPGTAFLELALHAGRRVGCPLVRELALHAPLVLDGGAGVQVQLVIGRPGESGERPVAVYSRPESSSRSGALDYEEDSDGEWTRHAEGTLALEGDAGGGWGVADACAVELAGEWPPPGATPVAIDGAYERLADMGLEYGPAFQGLRGAWRRGQEVFAEVGLGEELAGVSRGGTFGVHPALLDSAVHAWGLTMLDEEAAGGDGQGVRLPFVWGGVRLGVGGASRLRVHLLAQDGESGSQSNGSLSLVAVGEGGELAVSVGSLAVREVSPEQLRGGGRDRDSLFAVEWVPVEVDGRAVVDEGAFFGVASLSGALAEGVELPEVVVLDLTGECAGPWEGDLPGAARGVTGGTLGVLQGWLVDGRLVGSRLVVLTSGAVAAGPGDGVGGLAGAGVWGLVRSAQAESPERVWLVDLDGEESSRRVLGGALACEGEQQLGDPRGRGPGAAAGAGAR